MRIMINWNKEQTKKRARYPFSPKEDELLLKLVQRYGDNDNWELIASHFEKRNIR